MYGVWHLRTADYILGLDIAQVSLNRAQGEGGIPRKFVCVCEPPFPKPLPYLQPKSAIFPTLFMT